MCCSCMDYAHQALSMPQRTAEKSQAEALQAIQTAANHNAGTTSNDVLEHAYKILQEASESVTKLFNLHNALVVSVESPDQIRKSKILNERYQKASSTAKAQAAKSKKAEIRAHDAHSEALKLAKDTTNVVNDQGVIDSKGQPFKQKKEGISDQVKQFLSSQNSKSSQHTFDSPSSASFAAEFDNIRRAEADLAEVNTAKYKSATRHKVEQMQGAKQLSGQASVLIPYYCTRPKYKHLCKFYKSLKRKGHLSQPI